MLNYSGWSKTIWYGVVEAEMDYAVVLKHHTKSMLQIMRNINNFPSPPLQVIK